MKTGNLGAVSLALGAGVLTAAALALGSGFGDSGSRSAAASDPLYKDECGSCHVAYPVELLPPSDWARVMDSLENHFGGNAELDQATDAQIRKFLAANAGRDEDGDREYSNYGRNTRADGGLPRITETPRFISEHEEIPDRLVFGNREVGSFSHCGKCHARANVGDFDDDRVRIPGFGPWDD